MSKGGNTGSGSLQVRAFATLRPCSRPSCTTEKHYADCHMCPSCKHLSYCSDNCLMKDKLRHDAECSGTSNMIQALLMPARRELRYFGVYLDTCVSNASEPTHPSGFPFNVLRESQKYIGAASAQVLRPLRGPAEKIEPLRLIVAKDCHKIDIEQNVRGEIIMTPFNPKGSKIPIHSSNATIRGPVVVCKLAATGRPANFSLEEFESVWGLMTVQPLDKYYAVGGIMAKNDATEAALAETLRKAAASRSASATLANLQPQLRQRNQPKFFQNRMQRQMVVLVIAAIIIYVLNLQTDVKNWIFGI